MFDREKSLLEYQAKNFKRFNGILLRSVRRGEGIQIYTRQKAEGGRRFDHLKGLASTLQN